ncbi:MAG: OsmC family protein [Acidimicrobiales bacterium]
MTDPARTLTVTAVWGGGYRCEVAARQHRIQVDEPVSVQGTDTGSTPTELFLASLGSCFALALHHVAAKRGLEILSLQISVTGTYSGPSFGDLGLDIAIEANTDDAVIADLIDRAKAVCYISNTLDHPPPVAVRRV